MNKNELIKADNKKAGEIVDLNIIIDNKDLVISELKKNISVLEDSVKRTRAINQVLAGKIDDEQAVIRGLGMDKVDMAQELNKKNNEINVLIKTIFVIKENTLNNL